MAESETPADISSAAKETEEETRRPEKKRAAKKAKKTTRRTVKKTRAAASSGEGATDGARGGTRRSAKKRTTKKAKKTVAESEEKSGNVQSVKPQNDGGAASDSSLPSAALPDATAAPKEEVPKVEAVAGEVSAQAAEKHDAPAERAEETAPSESAPLETPSEALALEPNKGHTDEMVEEKPEETRSEMQWGRRTKRTAPLGWEEQGGLSDSGRANRPAAGHVEKEPPASASSGNAMETPASAPSGSAMETAPAPSDNAKETSAPAPNDNAVSVSGSEDDFDAVADEDESVEALQNGSPEAPGTRSESSEQESRRSRRRRRGRGRDRRNGEETRNRPPEEPRNRPPEETRSRGEETRNRPPEETRSRGEETRNRPPEEPRNRSGQHEGRTRGREDRPEGGRPSRSLAELLAETWTEDKVRRSLSDGLLARLSPRLTAQGESQNFPDAEALRDLLRMVRKVLADECMVADDATDLMLLDVVMSALVDRIEVCRLQAKSTALEDLDVLLDLRYKADRRLIEALNALKNA